ncbi:unnamed protein product, partial [Symbiodinium necroappetens]
VKPKTRGTLAGSPPGCAVPPPYCGVVLPLRVLSVLVSGNADMIVGVLAHRGMVMVWRQAVDTELRLAAQWEESWGFLKEQSAKDEAKRQKVVLPKLSDTKGYGSVSAAPAVSKDNVHDLPVSTPRLFLATSQQAYKQRPPIEKLHMKRWTVRRDPELWPTICPAK